MKSRRLSTLIHVSELDQLSQWHNIKSQRVWYWNAPQQKKEKKGGSGDEMVKVFVVISHGHGAIWRTDDRKRSFRLCQITFWKHFWIKQQFTEKVIPTEWRPQSEFQNALCDIGADIISPNINPSSKFLHLVKKIERRNPSAKHKKERHKKVINNFWLV